MTARPVFPAAAGDASDEHPRNCSCLPCIDVLLAEVSRPLVEPAPRVDPVLRPAVPPPLPGDGPDPSSYLPSAQQVRDAWAASVQHRGELDANRATRGPGTGGGAGRRPAGPGRRRAPGGARSDGCALAVVAFAAYVLAIALAAAAALALLLSL